MGGAAAAPTSYPNNESGGGAEYHQPNPYVHYSVVPKPPANPMDTVVQKLNIWSSKAEKTANNIWHNLKTGNSVSESAWGKMNLAAKAITGAGFEQLYKQSFSTFPNETLKKSFACYLSTTTGPVAGTLYLSNFHVAFCSDRPLSFTAPSGQTTWSYYKVLIPLGKVANINPVLMSDAEKYIQIMTVDGQNFWFMGFVNYEKASHHLIESVSHFAALGIPVQ
ncbi:hypothetical protein DCAR_0414844 [Daucus carota subsp. sativus]|uniref:GRAM domain-containing protein n=1 Tax=Daucus carota subsp. sativus TaxID=79200 RepID=A0AAF1AWY3_DAUCS|nr:PREDICTED: GEM-like protein 5 [Daucus carota subsp. sativus]WOG95521.1 hypothetical protein DCAR_0414844 [Daucus carota subsp. sativus]